jgi:hypothetical protein
MTVTTIPVTSTTDAFVQQVEMGGVIYDMEFSWNARDHHWSITIGRDGVVLVAGIKLVISDDLLAYSRRIEGLPSGRLQIVDLDDKDRDPDDTIFGNRVMLMYDDTQV